MSHCHDNRFNVRQRFHPPTSLEMSLYITFTDETCIKRETIKLNRALISGKNIFGSRQHVPREQLYEKQGSTGAISSFHYYLITLGRLHLKNF